MFLLTVNNSRKLYNIKRFYLEQTWLVYELNLPIPTSANAPSVMMAVCKVSVYITAARPPLNGCKTRAFTVVFLSCIKQMPVYIYSNWFHENPSQYNHMTTTIPPNNRCVKHEQLV